ncbi:hypothetical protein CTAYLR_005568 [Chrysophaeum taylorii]|uniref:Uncharacterized protein n=1 Tax=Chrysophaeum taylorii TaxID=2483200 RepID=A0AAD7U521_9STRA|nr:hypothetical protein CTAYLR_005568 [Chrysophaeum taylorii]
MEEESALWPSYLEFVAALLSDMESPERGELAAVPLGRGWDSPAQALGVLGPALREEALAGLREDQRLRRGRGRAVVEAMGVATHESLVVVFLREVGKEDPLLSEGSVVRFVDKTYGIVASSRDALPTLFEGKGVFRVLALRGPEKGRTTIEIASDALTAIREYQALKSLPWCAPELVGPLLAPGAMDQVSEPPARSPLWDALRARFDASQVEAISEATRRRGPFALVQGPPGTGKTRTILGIIGVLLCDDGTKRGAVRVIAKGRSGPIFPRPLRRVLVAAPSNAAVDELVARLLEDGVVGRDGTRRRELRICRVGVPGGYRGEEENPRVCTVSLDSLAADVDFEARPIDKELARGSARIARRIAVLLACDVVCATLSGAGSSILVDAAEAARLVENNKPIFDAVVVDEAAQAVEPSALIPLKYGPRRVVLVGDPQQLSATLLSDATKRAGYAQSLFERLWRASHPYALLQTQYRMHRAVCGFVSRHFYTNRLVTADDLEDESLGLGDVDAAAFPENDLFASPLAFHDLRYARATPRDQSYSNPSEAAFVAHLVSSLRIDPSRVGVITPYRAQIDEIRASLLLLTTTAAAAAKGKGGGPEVATVDAFQGREKDVIILSCVRTDNRIGFLSDNHRLNVALSRCRRAVWVVGHASTLGTNPDWRAYVDEAHRRDALRRWPAPPPSLAGAFRPGLPTAGATAAAAAAGGGAKKRYLPPHVSKHAPDITLTLVR